MICYDKNFNTFEDANNYKIEMMMLGYDAQVEVMEEPITENKQYIVFVW